MMYLGMNAQTGRRITDMAHITQSITDIVTTPITTRCMRRGYGSLLSDLIDDPQNPLLRLKAMSAAYSAIMRWEPRVVLTRVILAQPQAGKMTLELRGHRTDLADTFNLAIPVGGNA
ncbi:TPA: GPW/gp25 family protein [Yersinia enterocolitica]|nr:GPW/gp25 family protein [Yersinia enterocolitica]